MMENLFQKENLLLLGNNVEPSLPAWDLQGLVYYILFNLIAWKMWRSICMSLKSQQSPWECVCQCWPQQGLGLSLFHPHSFFAGQKSRMSSVSLPVLTLHIVFFKLLWALCPSQGPSLSLCYAARSTERRRWELIDCRKKSVVIKMAKWATFPLINSLLTAFPVQACTCDASTDPCGPGASLRCVCACVCESLGCLSNGTFITNSQDN